MSTRQPSQFAGVENELYYDPRTLMLFGDARGFVSALVKEVHAQAPVHA